MGGDIGDGGREHRGRGTKTRRHWQSLTAEAGGRRVLGHETHHTARARERIREVSSARANAAAPLRRSQKNMGLDEAQPHPSTLNDYIAVIRRRKWVVIQAMILVPVAAVLLSLHQHKLFQSSAQVYSAGRTLRRTSPVRRIRRSSSRPTDHADAGRSRTSPADRNVRSSTAFTFVASRLRDYSAPPP